MCQNQLSKLDIGKVVCTCDQILVRVLRPPTWAATPQTQTTDTQTTVSDAAQTEGQRGLQVKANTGAQVATLHRDWTYTGGEGSA